MNRHKCFIRRIHIILVAGSHMIEDVIREAMERGEFDNLPGKGRPLNLTQDPLLDPMTAIVNRILRDNGVSHPLIEARRTMEAEAEECRDELQRAWSIH